MSRASWRETILPPLWVITLLMLGASGWVIYQLKEIVVLLVVGYSIAYLMEPGIKHLAQRGISRSGGVLMILSTAVLMLLVLALTAIPTILREYDSLSQNFPGYITLARLKLETLLELASGYFPKGTTARDLLMQFSDYLPAVGQKTFSGVTKGIGAALMGGYSVTLTLMNLALLPFIVYYIALDFPLLHRRALEFFPLLQQARVAGIAREINSYVSAFVRGQMLVGALLFVLYALGLGLVGVELWFLLAVISGFGNMVPYLGTMAGIVLSSLMALVTFGDVSHLLQVWLVFGVVQFLEGNLITPRVLGESVGLSPLTIILAIVSGGILFGLIGIILAVPGVAALRVLLSNVHSWYMGKI